MGFRRLCGAVAVAVLLLSPGCSAPSPCDGTSCPVGTVCAQADGLCHCGGALGPLCADGESCDALAGACVFPSTACDRVSCTQGTSCDPTDGVCKCGGLGGVECGASEVCDAGVCAAPSACAAVVCGPGESCDDATGSCACGGGPGCAAGERCSSGACVVDLCAGVGCGGGTSCDAADGLCKCGGAGGLTCAAGESCDPDVPACPLAPTCLGVDCPGATSCDPDDGLCKCGGRGGAVCAADQVCDLGTYQCVTGNQCAGMTCRANLECDPEDGLCHCGATAGPVCLASEWCASPDGVTYACTGTCPPGEPTCQLPALVIDPPVLDFGEVGVGAPLSLGVQVTNTGPVDLVISSYEVRGSTAFTIVSVPPTAVIRNDASHQLVVEYAPGGVQSDVGRLVVLSDDPGFPEVESQLLGSGVDAATCGLQVAPLSVDFGRVRSGSGKVLEFGITNPVGSAGDCPVRVAGLTIGTDPEFGLPDGDSQSFVLAPGDTGRVQVQFFASLAGSYAGAVQVYSADPTTPVTVVPLLALVDPVGVWLNPDNFDFGAVTLGCGSAAENICVVNSGSTAVTLMELRFVAVGSTPEFFFQTLPPGVGTPSGESIFPGGSACFTLSYTPFDEGADHVALYAKLDEYLEPFLIALSGEGAPTDQRIETHVQLETTKADVLFIIDNSCSMGQEQIALTSSIGTFIGYAEARDVHYQLGVVTTDVTSFGNVPGLLHPQDGSRSRIVSPDDPDPAAAFTLNAVVGTSGSATERGLEAAYLALSDPLISDPAMNGGFLRPDARLSIIFLSDEEDQSSNVVDFYIDFFENLPTFNTASAIVGPVGGCSGAGGNASGGARYIEVQQRTGGVFESICSSDWPGALDRIADVALRTLGRIVLQGTPVVGTLTVTITDPGGSATPITQWTFDLATNTIQFNPLARPEPGEVVEISYTAECL